MRICKFATFALTGLLMSPWAVSQTVPPAATTAVAAVPTPVPAIVPYSGTVDLSSNKLSASETAVTFLIFKDETGGEPLFTETQTVIFDSAGHYKVQLGAVSPNGLPSELFSSGEARWLEVQVTGENPQPRVLLASVPYAMKAADAATLGGLPASAFALAGQNSRPESVSTEVTSNATSNVTTTGGAAGYVPEFSGTASIADSPIFVLGSDIGIGTATPSATLDVAGAALVTGLVTAEGGLTLPATGTATASGGFNSNLLKLYTSAYNSSMKAVVDPRFEWEAVVAGNDTASPSVTLELLSSTSTAGATPTGFSFNSNGTINFASGQTFPTAGTITGVTAGTALTGGGTSGKVTLSVDTTKVPLLASANHFTASQSVTGSVSASGQLVSTVATGTAPLAVSSTTQVPNLNASLLGGLSSSALAALAATNNFSATQIFSKIGIGTSTPRSSLEAVVDAPNALGPTLTLTNSGGTTNPSTGYAAASIDFNTYYHPAVPYNNPTARIEAIDDNNYGSSLVFLSKIDGGDAHGLQTNMDIQSNGQVAIAPNSAASTGTSYNAAQLTVGGNLGYIGIVGVGSTEHDGIDGFGGYSTNGDLAGSGGTFQGGYSTEGDGGYGIAAYVGEGSNGFSGVAGYFDGDVYATGNISQGGSNVAQIDHPLDPANKYLNQASIQSSEMVNIYSGNVTTDELGLATVQLPDWFESENTDFRYQLTVVGGGFAQAIISKEVDNHQFTISTNASNVKVSWQITGVRQDAYAKAHPLTVEQVKPQRERGFYLHPELFGQPKEKQTEWGRNPQLMRQLKTRHTPDTLKKGANSPDSSKISLVSSSQGTDTRHP